MPYQKSTKLPGEAASKIGHVPVVNDPFIKELLNQFESREMPGSSERGVMVENAVLESSKVAEFVLAIDGSISTVPNTLADYKKMSYINVATICLNLTELIKANQPVVDPFFIKDILSKNSDTLHAVVPLSGFYMQDKTMIETIRQTINAQMKKISNGQILETLKFLIFREWLPSYDMSEHFACLNKACRKDIFLERGKSDFECPHCGEPHNIVDYLGIINEANDESNSDSIAMSFMMIIEHLNLIYYLRSIPNFTSSKVLLIKDGPLMLRSQYSRLVEAIRSFLEFHLTKHKNIAVIGVEKTGSFVDHLPLLRDSFNGGDQIFIPQNDYILRYIKQSPADETLYGERVLYGAKVFFKIDRSYAYVLNVPLRGGYDPNPNLSQLLNADVVFSTIPKVVSSQFENSLAPIAAANRIASMSMYPSNSILDKFTRDNVR